MQIEVLGKGYYVDFVHASRGGHKTTYCYIYVDPKHEDHGVGRAVCSKRDTFNKRTARRLAFGRALQEAIPRDERLLWWQAYFKAMPGDSLVR